MYVARNIWERVSTQPKGVPLLFVHTPKCGGSYVGDAFRRYRKACIGLTEPALAGHLTWREYRDRLPVLGHNIEEFSTFSVVRNPFDWHVSWFNYIRKYKGGKRSGYHLEHLLFQEMDFPDYVRWLDDPDQPKSLRFEMGRNVSDWVLNEDGAIGVDHILRQEQLKDDLTALLKRLDLQLPLSNRRVNASNDRDYRGFYTDAEVDIIARRHAVDLELFGYQFEP